MLDASTLDATGVTGQLRYIVDLVRNLAAIRPPADFVLLGSRPAPLPELQAVFAESASAWRYRRFEHAGGRAGLLVDQVRVRRVLREERAALFHNLHSFIPLLAPCSCVTTVYDMMMEMFDEYAPLIRSRRHRLYRWSVRHRAARVLAISRSTAEDVQRVWGIDAARIDVTPLGTRLESIEPSEPPPGMLPSGAATHVLLSPYNLEPRKNLAALVEAFARLRAARPDVELVLYGRAALNADRERAFEELIARLGVGTAIRRVGVVDDATLAGLFRRATVFVFPSLYEGFGLPVLEAMWNGCAVVARSKSSMVEVLGDAGALIETSDPRAIEHCVAGLLDDPERRRRLGEAAKVRARSFTLERMARETWRSYARALGREEETP